MTSKPDICNMALGHIHASPNIVDFASDESKEADMCRLYFDPSRRAVLRSYDWGFARSQVFLEDLGDPPTGWRFRYRAPARMIAARGIAQADKATRPVPFQVANALDGTDDDTVILTDAGEAELIFTADITNVALFNAGFVIAHSYLLAWMLGMAVAGKRELAAQALQAFNQFLRSATAQDARESATIPAPDAPWLAARH